MNSPFTSDDRSITAEKVMYILSIKKEGTADEIATEIMELQGISSEDGVAEVIIEVENLLMKLKEQGKINVISGDAPEEWRYGLPPKQA